MSKSVSKFALAAGLVLAMAFTFSCSGDDGGDSNTGTCGGKKYDITYYSCESGELVGSCRGKPYYPEFESCENGEIIDGAEISSSSSRNSSSSGGGLNMSDLPKQVYLVETDYDNKDYLIILKKERYNGNVNVSVLFSDIVDQTCSCTESSRCECSCTNTKGEVFECKYEYEYDTIPAGKIQNGQLSLNLPAINSKYLEKLEPCNDEYCQSNISVVPRNLTFIRRSSLEATIPGKKECYLRPYRTKSGTTNRAQFYYFSESGSITGTETYTEPDYYSQTNFDMNFSKGWNLVYYDVYESNQNHNYYRTYTTDIPKDGTWEWWLQCSDEDNSDPSSSSGAAINLSDLPKQVYNYDDNGNLVFYDGNGDIVLPIGTDYIPVGKITNGELSFDSLPNIKSNYSGYLTSFSGIRSFLGIYDPSCTNNLNYPSGLSIFPESFKVNIPGKSCEIILGEIIRVEGYSRTAAILAYFSQSGSITGTVTCGEYGDTETWDARNFPEGWNLIYLIDGRPSGAITTSPSRSGNYAWYLQCDD